MALVSFAVGQVCSPPGQCLAEWTKTIECPADRVYRDVRRDAGREEFCELLLPGSLRVRDGPFRSWYSEGHPGEEGSYQKGRKIGQWRECSRFDDCRDQSYEPLYANEEARGVKPEIPLLYSLGKYRFDFASCRSTWVTHQTAESFLELNIYNGLVRCQLTYIPSVERDRPAGNQGHYFCEIPYSVGVREFDSLDLRKELPKAGLPQFCRKDNPAGAAAMGFAIWGNVRFIDGRTRAEVPARTPLANLVDVECAAISGKESGAERLTVRLNQFAERLVLERAGKDEVEAEVCGGRPCGRCMEA